MVENKEGNKGKRREDYRKIGNVRKRGKSQREETEVKGKGEKGIKGESYINIGN